MVVVVAFCNLTKFQTTLEYSPSKVLRIINTTACLHNFAMHQGDMYIEKGGKVVNLHNDIEDRDPLPFCGNTQYDHNLGKITRDDIRKKIDRNKEIKSKK